MTISPYMWRKDARGADIRGSVDFHDREGSIEIIGMSHGINLPVDGIIQYTDARNERPTA